MSRQDKTEIIKTTTEIEHNPPDEFANVVESSRAYADKGYTTVIELSKEVKKRTNSVDISEWVILTDIGEDQCNFKWIQQNFGPGRYRLCSKFITADNNTRRKIYTTPEIAIGSLDQADQSTQPVGIDTVGVIREMKDVLDKSALMQDRYMKTVVDMVANSNKNDITKEIFNSFAAVASKPAEPKDNSVIVAAIQNLGPAILKALEPKEPKQDKTVELMFQQSIEDRKMLTTFMMESLKQANQPKRSFDMEKAAGVAMQVLDFVSSKFKDNSNTPAWLQLVIENSEAIKEVVGSASGLLTAYLAPKVQALAQKSLPVEQPNQSPKEEEKSNGKDLFKAILKQLTLTKKFDEDPSVVAEAIKQTPEYSSGYIETIKENMDEFLACAEPSQVNWLIQCFNNL